MSGRLFLERQLTRWLPAVFTDVRRFSRLSFPTALVSNFGGKPTHRHRALSNDDNHARARHHIDIASAENAKAAPRCSVAAAGPEQDRQTNPREKSLHAVTSQSVQARHRHNEQRHVVHGTRQTRDVHRCAQPVGWKIQHGHYDQEKPAASGSGQQAAEIRQCAHQQKSRAEKQLRP